jgi:hypothetical protein
MMNLASFSVVLPTRHTSDLKLTFYYAVVSATQNIVQGRAVFDKM